MLEMRKWAPPLATLWMGCEGLVDFLFDGAISIGSQGSLIGILRRMAEGGQLEKQDKVH